MATKKQFSRWALEFTEMKKQRSKDKDRDKTEDAPPGYCRSFQLDDETEASDSTLVAKQGWNFALGPLKQLPMNLFVLWMAGNSVSIFPIMMVGMMFIRPVQTLLSLKEVFEKLKGDQAIFQKFIYILANLLCILLAVYKFHNMGVLPTHPSDWLEFMEPKKVLELSGGGETLN